MQKRRRKLFGQSRGWLEWLGIGMFAWTLIYLAIVLVRAFSAD